MKQWFVYFIVLKCCFRVESFSYSETPYKLDELDEHELDQLDEFDDDDDDLLRSALSPRRIQFSTARNVAVHLTTNSPRLKPRKNASATPRTGFNSTVLSFNESTVSPSNGVSVEATYWRRSVVGTNVEIDIMVPREAFLMVMSQTPAMRKKKVQPVTLLYENISNDSDRIRSMYPSKESISWVIKINFPGDAKLQNLSRPVKIQNMVETSKYGEESRMTEMMNQRVRQRCVFWENNDTEWSSRGCCLNNTVFPPTCQCNHMTSFALIVSVEEIPRDVILSTVSDIALYLSIIGLLVTNLLIILNKKARRKDVFRIQLHINFNLSAAYLLFVTGVSRTENATACNVITILLHCSFLAGWLWMAIYSNRVYMAVSQVFKTPGPHFMLKSAALAYGLPLLVVGVNASVTLGYLDHLQVNTDVCDQRDKRFIYYSHYRAENMCWLHGYSLYFGFLLIVGIVLMNNVVLIIRVLRLLHLNAGKVRSSASNRSKLREVVTATSLVLSLGVTWVFGFLLLFSTDVTYQLAMNWLFAIFSATQGVSIWFLTCVKRAEMRSFWWIPLKNKLLSVFGFAFCHENKHVNRKKSNSRTGLPRDTRGQTEVTIPI